MKILLFSLVLAISSIAQASVMYIQRDTFSCSDSKTYHVARHFSGGWGPGNWKVIALCNLGILKQESYNGRYHDPRDSSPEVAKCIDEDTKSIRSCYSEFSELNSMSGKGNLPQIRNYKRAEDVAPSRGSTR
ncbi:MAG: hypothetical protein SGI74_06380 [Oligoflexia bacterium]|nr:hypothetical protein [Oligoflexia bacterium]